MKKIRKYILTPLICLVISYLFVAFCRWEINPSQWDSVLRFIVAAPVVLLIMFFIIKEHE